MKIRSGFVSNSSSSSFIVFGVYMNSEPDDMSGIESVFLEHGNKYIVGYVIADGEELPERQVSIGKLIEWSEKLSEKLNVDKEEITLISGVRAC
jgi:hypothetical protein